MRTASSIRWACWNDCAAETRDFEGAYSKLSVRVDRLLRELANPNLHDIANMNFRVELWDRYGQHIRWVVAASGTVTSAMLLSRRP